MLDTLQLNGPYYYCKIYLTSVAQITFNNDQFKLFKDLKQEKPIFYIEQPTQLDIFDKKKFNK